MSDLKDDLELFHTLSKFLIDNETQKPVAPRIETDELFEKLDLGLSRNGLSNEHFAQVFSKVLSATPKTSSSRFFNQLFGGRQGKAVIGDLMAVLLNNSMYTYKVAGPQVGIEQELIRRSCALVGFGDQSGGTFPAGGSMSNFMALIMARDAADPYFRTQGTTRKMCMYTSSESHYSNQKNARFAGIGSDNIRSIQCDEKGRIIPEKLEQQIALDLAEGNLPFFVNATAGTTVLGAFDPVEEIADICQEYNLWLHVDGAYSGAVIFSDTHKHLVRGVHRADSFSYNAHKMLGTPLSCSLILVKDRRFLYESFSNEAEYLYQTDDDGFNLGKTSFQCGRRNDALKFWTLWKSIGTEGLEHIVDHQFELSQTAREYVRSHPDYELYSFDDSVSICFNYKGIPAKDLCTILYEEQVLVVGFGSFGGEEFVRLVTVNANNSRQDILAFFTALEEFVEENAELFESAMTPERV